MSTPAAPHTIFFDLGDTLIFNDGSADRLFPDTLDVLQLLKERGYRLGLLSNQSPGKTVAQVIAQLAGLHLDGYIESSLVTISTEIAGNVGKPAQPIFNLALQKAGHTNASTRSIFITETPDHIVAARGYGWRAILKRNTGSCVAGDGECVTSLTQLLPLLPALGTVTGTNLSLAPAPKLVDGLWAVPIDISRITATLTFDAATSTSTGSGLFEFTLGRNAGSPIFDLRQTITALTLDGEVIPANKANHHVFGGGTDAKLRVLERSLEAGTSHQLEVAYAVGLPDAPPGGSSQPQLDWASGGRLTLKFGFTDLAAGRYLEAWVPSNLIFDQFELVLTLRIINTAVPHSLISNGTVSVLGANAWQVRLPATAAALSPWVELHPSDSVTSSSAATVLPVSGAAVTVEAWKSASNPLNLVGQITAISTRLAQNETDVGPYLHGGRFVAYIRSSNSGGMEYDGGTSTSIGALPHEVLHSWWGRGIKPASQPDGWLDEAIATYAIDDGPSSLPCDFSESPMQLCSRNPWARITSDKAYTKGSRFIHGIAGITGVATLRSLLAEWYSLRDGRPVTTQQFEEFLLCRTGDPLIVDAFHRFVYGFSNPSPIPEAWMRDHFNHEGSESWLGGSFWDSPDLWVRNADDGGVEHQNPRHGRDNWLYARVRNASATATIAHFVVAFNARPYAGVEFTYPYDFLPCMAAASGFSLAPGTTVIVRAKWPKALVPSVGTHACLLSSVFTRSNHPLADKHVWEQNALAQKNLSIVNAPPDTWFVIPFVIGNRLARVSTRHTLELVRPREWPALKAELLYARALDATLPPLREPDPPAPDLDPAGIMDFLTRRDAQASQLGQDSQKPGLITSATPERLESILPGHRVAEFSKGQVGRIALTLAAGDQRVFGLKIYVPATAKKGETIALSLAKRQTDSRNVLGGIAVRMVVA